MFNGSVKVATFRGVPILAHWSLLLVVWLLAPSLARSLGLATALITVVLFILAVLAHEVAHVVAARRFGVRTTKVQLWALGGAAHLDRVSPSPRAEGWIAVAGPLASLAIGAAGVGTSFAFDALGFRAASDAALWIGVINIGLAVFNMLPGAPLDGGRVLRAARWRRHGDRDRAVGEAARAGIVLGWAIACGGLWLTLNGNPAFLLIVSGLFLALNAKAEEVGSKIAARLRGTRVRELTLFGVAQATGDTTVATMLWQRSRLGLPRVVAVSGGDPRTSGIVTEDQMWSVPEDRRDEVTLSSLVTSFEDVGRAGLDDDLADVIGHVNPRQPLLTVWNTGSLVGVISGATLHGRLRDANAGGGA